MPGTSTGLQDFTVNVKIKLAGLWASLMFCYIYGDYFELYVPGKTEGLVNGKNLLDSPAKLFAATLLLTIPSLMICLSLLLKPRVNRMLNIVWGAFYAALMLLIAVTSFSEWRLFYVFLALTETILAITILVTAVKWPKNM
ncbi:hypothetical protein HHL16_11080 [Pseudoflavitalea sp. G-6-1-2]|uniref:DUF6326 family protein n=1 Tax=Pseudoflavitalea sp. G-6-1-2 TaxID=2728841 RepID=UPI00146B5C3B|nr:DUF6326 family protein [Pseudoflavitalea sp. G-6-1-2]NML21421.1 hypothetical protein [Pseudoflavitalea sp. G-6-1-2]